MFSISINRLFPFPKLFKVLVVMSVLLQCVIISYNHFFGYYDVAKTHGLDKLKEILNDTYSKCSSQTLIGTTTPHVKAPAESRAPDHTPQDSDGWEDLEIPNE